MHNRTLITMAIAMMLLFAHLAVERAFSQPQQSNTMTHSSAFSPDSRSDKPYDIAQRLEMLEYKLDIETKALEKRYEDFSKSATFIMSILSIFVAVLTIFAIYKSLQQHKDYITERTLFTQQADKIEKREEPFAKAQLENIDKLNSVISLVEKTFDLQHKREEAQSTLIDELNHMKSIIKEFEEEAEEKYSDAKELILSLTDVKAMNWPKLTDETQYFAARARNKFEEVSRVVLRKEEKQNPYELAKVFQLIGISAFYSNDIASAFKQLGEADRIYETKSPRPDDAKSRAYTKHFLGVAAKNWRKTGDVARGNINEAYEYSSKADEIVKGDPQQFLIPVTLAEILSYRSDQKQDATAMVDKIIDRFKKLENQVNLDANQHSLFVRTLLLKGNLEMTENKFDQAVCFYDEALKKDSKNAYTHLSLLHAQKLRGDIVDSEKWEKALLLLESSGTTKKRETITRVIALVWAVIAAHEGNVSIKERYLKDLDSIGTTLSSIAHREPLFFSPISKDLVDFTDLKTQLSQYLKTGTLS